MRAAFRSLATIALAAGFACGQDLVLDRTGGALGAAVNFDLQGNPNEPYVIVLDLIEQTTPIPALGVTLAITDQFAWFSFQVPGFFGTTDASGDAAASFPLPADPAFADVVFSLQAIAGVGPFRVSNLLRLTPQLPGSFAPTLTSPALPVAGGGAVALTDREWLFVGGSGPIAQRYQSRTEEWQVAGLTFGVGLLAQTTELADGRVLFTGGLDATTGQPTDAAAVYDPATQTTTTITMSSPRAGHGSSLLQDGRVLISGGLSAFDLTNPLGVFDNVLNSTELFDPTSSSFTAGPVMLEARALHTSTTLASGEVLVAGGLSVLPIVNVPTVSSTAYLYNPNSNGFGLPSFFNGGRLLHSATALSNGRVLLVGGVSVDLTQFLQTGNLADLVLGTRDDCVVFTQGLFGLGSFATVNGMQVGRAGAGVAELAASNALITGGFELTIDVANQTFVLAPHASADRYSAGTGTLSPTGAMAAPRIFPLLVPQADGTVLVVGGGPTTAEVYQR